MPIRFLLIAVASSIATAIFVAGSPVPVVAAALAALVCAGAAWLVGERTARALSEEIRRIRHDEATAAGASERERVARELHDGVAKLVSALSLEVAALARRQGAETGMARVERLARQLADELRAIVRDFRSRGTREPFGDVLERTANGYGARLALQGDVEEVKPLARFELVRILEEALRNAESHARASHVTASLSVEQGRARLAVVDDGSGIGQVDWDALPESGHFGLIGMRERARRLDGDLAVSSRPGGGTLLVADVPVHGGA